MNAERIWYWTQLISRTQHAYAVAPPQRLGFIPRPIPSPSLIELLLTVATQSEEENEELYETVLADMLAWKSRLRSSPLTSDIDRTALEIRL